MKKQKFKPTLEALEDRLCPAAPVITITSVVEQSDATVEVRGTVADENPAACWVSWGGVFQGEAAVQPDANGDYVAVMTPTSQGTIIATATDPGFLQDTEFGYFDSNTPVIQFFSATLISGRTWRFAGKVNDESPGGKLVHFSGLQTLVGKTAECDPDGDFELTIELAVNETGYALADFTDRWGQVAQQASYFI